MANPFDSEFIRTTAGIAVRRSVDARLAPTSGWANGRIVGTHLYPVGDPLDVPRPSRRSRPFVPPGRGSSPRLVDAARTARLFRRNGRLLQSPLSALGRTSAPLGPSHRNQIARRNQGRLALERTPRENRRRHHRHHARHRSEPSRISSARRAEAGSPGTTLGPWAEP